MARGLIFDAYNANLPERIAQYGGDCRKISADYYCDDRNYWIIPETDKLIGILKTTDYDMCQICQNRIKCTGKTCDRYMSGIGGYNAQTGEEYPDFKWSCESFDFGTCDKMEDTPCNGCIKNNWRGFEWNRQ